MPYRYDSLVKEQQLRTRIELAKLAELSATKEHTKGRQYGV